MIKKYNAYEIKGIIGLCDFFIGSRMHSCIAALSQGIPTIGVAYSKKFIGIFNSVDLGTYVIDARLYDEDEAINIIFAIYNKMKKDRYVLERIKKAQSDIFESFKTILY
jgi:polysaccharide pyruvyl transferase WcaK-like protein